MDDMEKNICSCGHDHDHDEDCSCGHEHQYMTLMLEDNTEVKCIVVGIFELEEYENKQYIALVTEDGEESFIYEYAEVDNEDGFELRNIESDEEFENVVAAIDEMLESEEEDFDDDDDYEYDDEE